MEAEAAAVYADFLADFSGPTTSAKAFVRGAIEHGDEPDQSINFKFLSVIRLRFFHRSRANSCQESLVYPLSLYTQSEGRAS
jgi:hypothetical protein